MHFWRFGQSINPASQVQRAVKSLGFTLIELLAVVMVLSVLSLGVFGFIGNSVQVYLDATERDQLLSDSRFLIERMTLEIRHALPNSLRLAQVGSQRHCLEFVPIEGATAYLSAPISPATATNEIVAVEITANDYQFSSGQSAVIYPTSNADVYGVTPRRAVVQSVTDDDGNGTPGETTDSDGVIRFILTSNVQFPLSSPTQRLYLVNQPVSYCVHNNGNVTRHQDYGFLPIASANLGDIGNGSLMAENNANTLSLTIGTDIGDPFRVEQATLRRNAVANLLLNFTRNDESISFNHEVHVINAP